MTAPRILDLECTGRGGHKRRSLARFTWVPADRAAEGTAIYDPRARLAEYAAAPRLRFAPIVHGRRRSEELQTTPTPTANVVPRRRGDGGLSFDVDPCPICRRPIVVRNSTLERFVLASYAGATRSLKLDVSALSG